MLAKILSLDITALHYINAGLSNRWLDLTMPLVTFMGSIYFVLLFSLVLVITKKPKDLVLVGIVYASNILSFEILKYLVGRDRPFITHNVILRAGELSLAPGNVFSAVDPSFPSAHTATAFMLATILAYYTRGYKVLFYSIAAAVGLSRVYLGVHYPSDVIAGFILGTVIARLCLRSAFLHKRVLREKNYSSTVQS
jgi:undecaprenyl-diphosphatase